MSKDSVPKAIAFVALKGGVGKTTSAYNYGEWLVNHSKQVLFIDLDQNCDLSQTLQSYKATNTVRYIFQPEDGHADIINIKPNLDLITGDPDMEDVEYDLALKTNKYMRLYLWFIKNIDSLMKYDYIIMDCHPDFGTITKNAIILSDVLLSPITPQKAAYNKKGILRERISELSQEAIDYKSGDTFVTAKLWFYGNNIAHNTRASRELKAQLENEKDVIGIIPKREIFNTSLTDNIPIAEMEKENSKYSRFKDFFSEMNDFYEKVTTKINSL